MLWHSSITFMHSALKKPPPPRVPVWLCPRHPHIPSKGRSRPPCSLFIRFLGRPARSAPVPLRTPNSGRAPHPTIDLPHPPKARSTPSLLTLTFRHPNTHTHLHTRSCRTCKAAKFKQGSTRCAAASCDKILKKINIGTRTKAERDYQVRRRGQELPRAYIYLACTTCPCELMGWVASI